MTYDRYAVHEDENFEPGSNGVLKNFLNIKDKDAIEQLEAKELLRLGQELMVLYDENYQFQAEDLCNIHELWLFGYLSFCWKVSNGDDEQK